MQAWLSLALAGCDGPRDWVVAKATSPRGLRWLPFYGEAADDHALSSYDLVVLDPGFKGSPTEIAETGTRVCGYISLGEIRVADPFFARLDPAALMEENPAWPGTRRIDVRHQAWRDLVLDDMIPSMTEQGFTGLLLDTLDTPPYLEQVDPVKNKGMRAAAAGLVHGIRERFPDLLVIMNRGYALLPGVALDIDAIVAESLLTSPDPAAAGGYRWNDPADVALQLSLLTQVPRGRAAVPILSLDYWDPTDQNTVEQIYRRERELGHHPYVGTRVLDRILPEPAAVQVAPQANWRHGRTVHAKWSAKG